MKKFLLLVLVAFISSTMSAQLVTSTTVAKTKKAGKSGMFMEVGIGALGADYDGDGVALDLGFGYRKGFTENFAWDVFKIKATAELSNLSETITPQIMTGIRGTTPVLFGNMTAFGSISAGYGYWLDFEEGGFAYEAQVGLNITSKIYAAFVYENQALSWEDDYDEYDANVSFTGLRVGFRF